MNNKEKYRQLCAVEPSIPIFSQDWWLDMSCGIDNWDVALVEQAGKINASLPYSIEKKRQLTYIGQPKLTPHLGPWLAHDDSKYAQKISHEKQNMSALIEQLPRFDHFKQNFNPNITNWLPFFLEKLFSTNKLYIPIK
jgi:hypothetical protein